MQYAGSLNTQTIFSSLVSYMSFVQNTSTEWIRYLIGILLFSAWRKWVLLLLLIFPKVISVSYHSTQNCPWRWLKPSPASRPLCKPRNTAHTSTGIIKLSTPVIYKVGVLYFHSTNAPNIWTSSLTLWFTQLGQNTSSSPKPSRPVVHSTQPPI